MKLRQLELLAANEIDTVYDALRSQLTVTRIAAFFDAMNQAAREIMGKYGQRAVDESNRYNRQLFQTDDLPVAKLADLTETLEDFIDEFEEHVRHVRALVAIRSRRMVRKGVGAETITAVLLNDFDRGGEMFAFLKNSLKRSTTAAVLQLGKDAEFAPLRAKEAQGGK